MAASKLSTKHTGVKKMEYAATKFAAAAALDGAVTVPAGTTSIIVACSGAIHWHPTGTPTSTYGHAVAADIPFELTHAQHGAKIIGDGGAVNVIAAFNGGV